MRNKVTRLESEAITIENMLKTADIQIVSLMAYKETNQLSLESI